MLFAMFFCFFIFNDLRWELIVHFIDIGRIVLHHCLNSLLFSLYHLNFYFAQVDEEFRRYTVCASKTTQVFYLLLKNVLLLTIQLSRGECRYRINRFNITTFLCLSQTTTLISNIICHVLFGLQWVKVRGDCSFCWHWWNGWPSLFKISFHKHSLRNS